MSSFSYASSTSNTPGTGTRTYSSSQPSQTVSGPHENTNTGPLSLDLIIQSTSDSSNTNTTPSASQSQFSTVVGAESEQTPPRSYPVTSRLSAQPSDTTETLPSPWGSPSPEGPPPPPSDGHRHNVGAIIAIVLGVLALLLCIALAVLFFLRRRARARRKARRTSSGSPWQRLKPHVYGESSSRPESSIWTWFGSIPIDTDYKSQQEPMPHSPGSRFVEKDAGPTADDRLEAYSPRPSPCPSPTPSETRLLSRDAPSVHSLHDGLPYLTVPTSSAPEASSSSSELLALAGTDYAVANPFSDIHEVRVGRSVSGVSRTTASSGEVQSVEAL
ncbi:hypothetical protein V8D89_010027 [Ganoderma adspersum]